MEIKMIDIKSLIFAEYNPRKASDLEKDHIRQSIERFGIVDPIIVNIADNRKNIIVGGHLRVLTAKEMGITEVPCVFVNISDVEKEKELNLRLNKNLGHFDLDLLSEFEPDLFKDVGFDLEELSLENEQEEEIESFEKIEKELSDYRRVHILLSFQPEKIMELSDLLEKIKKIEGVEYEQSAN